MKALILSAGRGRRLWPFTADAPKCLLPVGAGDILGHQLETLREAGVSQVVLVCGHGLHQMQRRVAKLPVGISVRLIFNPFFSISDNLVSLWAARAEMDQGFILSNGDNLFHPDILKPLLAADGDCCLLAQRKTLYMADDMKIQVTGDRVTRIGKSLVGRQTHAESVGIMKFSKDGAYRLRRALEEVVTAPTVLRRFFVDAIQHLVDKGFAVNWADTDGLPWIDIDTPNDLEFAQANSHLFNATLALPTATEGRL